MFCFQAYFKILVYLMSVVFLFQTCFKILVFVFSDLKQEEIDQPDTASTYEMLTYTLAAVGALLIVIVIIMCIVLIRKTSVKKY